jgi:lipoprotein-anchoring transpeptidase ErfK/SrfK
MHITMTKRISRQDFLKIAGLAITGLAFNPFPPYPDEYQAPSGPIGRVTRDISIFRAPTWPDGETVGFLHRDELVNIYYEVTPASGPPYNPVWYRCWNGYIHSGYVQIVHLDLNPPVSSLPETGQICEVTVPYTQIYQYNTYSGWLMRSRLYYQSTHWAVSVDEGPDGQPWYRLWDELTREQYHVPALHMRIIPDEEISPISPQVPPEEKRIEVSLADQTLTAYESNTVVLSTKISSGLNQRPDPNEIGWNTPVGTYHIQSKYPSKHMGAGDLAGDGSDLPGVPWTCFFESPPGYAFHGAYWHHNFGLQMSHGCINMQMADSKWLFRWSTHIFRMPIESRRDWYQTGYGTLVNIT